MGYQNCFSWTQIPDVQVMHVYYALSGLELFLDFVNLDVLWGGLHDDLIAVFGDGPCGTDNN